MLWRDLAPEPGILSALEHAGPRLEEGTQNDKRRWSEQFANGCAVTIAETFRGLKEVRGKKILPFDLASGTEPLTPLGSGASKRIDVTVVDPILGLEIGVSLKGLNFRDSANGNFDKNLTGRLYELADEVRLVHEHLPHALMVGLFFLPLDSTEDKTAAAPSSFAKTVTKLRERTGRLDPSLPAQAAKCDMSMVALYSLGGAEEPPRGSLRFFPVVNNPPRRGRPRLPLTMGLEEFGQAVVAAATQSTREVWSDPEVDA